MVYNMLLKDHFITPRIVDKYRDIDYKETFPPSLID